jgi:radical SAM superfamily enzyme YgiQ (UPF0313 family)
MFKILFYHASTPQNYNENQIYYLNVSSLYLKTYLDIHKPSIAKQIEWILPQQEKLTDEELIAKIEKEQPDMFCTGHYTWNDNFISDQVARIKPKLSKNIIFVSGGPSIDVNVNPTYFQERPHFDYAVYGSGEVGFADLVESIIENKKLIKFNTSNIAWHIDGKQITAEYKYVAELQISPYTSNEKLFTDMVNDLQVDKGYRIILPYQLTRGCPYSCTFCDWNSGFGNKTTRRKGSYKDEIDLFQKIGVKGIWFADANTGQYQEDLEMIEYMAKKNIEENAGFCTDGNFSKLRKENNLKIYHMLAKANLVNDVFGIYISIQDTNPEILKNIDRPDVGWEVHKSIIKELHDTYPKLQTVMQIIQGLPGQTVQSWKETLDTSITYTKNLQIFINELLPAAPASRDPEYQKKWNFEYSKAVRWDGTQMFRGHIPKSCSSYTQREFCELNVLSTFYNGLAVYRKNSSFSFDVLGVANDFVRSKNYNLLVDNLYNNWLDDKFYYTINFEGVESPPISACIFRKTGEEWTWTSGFLKLIPNNLIGGISPKEFFKNSFATPVTPKSHKLTNWFA